MLVWTGAVPTEFGNTVGKRLQSRKREEGRKEEQDPLLRHQESLALEWHRVSQGWVPAVSVQLVECLGAWVTWV